MNLPEAARALLCEQFAIDPVPSIEMRREMAEALNLTEKQVLTWFQNRRRRYGGPEFAARRRFDLPNGQVGQSGEPLAKRAAQMQRQPAAATDQPALVTNSGAHVQAESNHNHDAPEAYDSDTDDESSPGPMHIPSADRQHIAELPNPVPVTLPPLASLSTAGFKPATPSQALLAAAASGGHPAPGQASTSQLMAPTINPSRNGNHKELDDGPSTTS